MQFAAQPLRPVESASPPPPSHAALIPNIVKTWETRTLDDDGRVVEHCVHFASRLGYSCVYLIQEGETPQAVGRAERPNVTPPPKVSIINSDSRAATVREQLARGMTYNEIVKASNGLINLYFINKLIREEGHGT